MSGTPLGNYPRDAFSVLAFTGGDATAAQVYGWSRSAVRDERRALVDDEFNPAPRIDFEHREDVFCDRVGVERDLNDPVIGAHARQRLGAQVGPFRPEIRKATDDHKALLDVSGRCP